MQQRTDPDQLALPARTARAKDGAGRELVLLLDLSNSPEAAESWANQNLAPAEIRSIAKADLKWGSKFEALRQLRLMKPRVFAVFCQDLAAQSATCGIQIFGALAGARAVILADHFGRTIRRSWYWALSVAPLALVLQLAVGYALLAPLAWLATLALEALSPIIRSGSPSIKSPRMTTARKALYLRATPASASVAGGMASHVSGFAGGASALGHHLDFISSGELTGIDPSSDVHPVPLSTSISATRALFELWNSITYTIAAVRIYKRHSHDRCWEFIYQRYNRFNCAGVLLSTLSGLPLLLEYNGSEVWVGRNWDPIGMMPLLKRFEQVNQRGAESIIVVSTAESRNLQSLGIPADRIVVNPNGVDTDKFHPGCGGGELREDLGLADKIVIGFLGSFGPWHGTEVLARAAVRIGTDSGCHFLFVGAGDLRTQTESIISQANCAGVASFVGRIPHSSIPRYLDACDILVAPHVPMPDGSAYFGSPTKLFEYLAMARPVVASRLGQMSEILVDGQTAILVEPGDPSDLAAAILRLAKDHELRKKLGSSARSMVMSRYTWRDNAARAFGAFELLLERAEGRRGTGAQEAAGSD